jgi:hypothetical protein
MFRLPPDCVEPMYQTVLDYWEGKRPTNDVPAHGLPARRDIDPMDLPPAIWPQILLFDVVEGEAPDGAPLRFRLRLAGTGFRQLAGRDVTGLYFDELGPPERTAPVIRQLRMVVAERRPCYLVGRVTVRNDAFEDIGRLALPLDNDGVIDKILGIWSVRPLGRDVAPAEPFDGVPRLLEGA